MISLFGSLLLIVVGGLSATEELSKYRPSLRLWLEGISPFKGYIGIGCVSYGLVSTLTTLMHFGHIRYMPFIYLATLAAGLVGVGAGMLLGYPTAAQFLMNQLPPEVLEKLESFYQQLLPQQKSLGFAALALGVFHILLKVVGSEMFFWTFRF